MNRLTHCEESPQCFSSVQRLSLIYLVKERLVVKTRDRCCSQHLSLMFHATFLALKSPDQPPPGGSGGATRDRTADLLNANQALSQLSYSPVAFYYKHIVQEPALLQPQIVSVLGVGGRRTACYASPSTTTYRDDLVGLGRFELPTSPLSGVRSNQLSYRPAVTVCRASAALQGVSPSL